MTRDSLGKGDVLVSSREFWAVPALLALSAPFVFWHYIADESPLFIRILVFALLSASATIALRPFIVQCFPLSKVDGGVKVHREVVVLFIINLLIYMGIVLSVLEWMFELGLYRILQAQQ
ncbi:MAG: hypothetical protein WD114_06375 [Phycisphaerales bacterium]